MRKVQQGFTLMELMIVVAIIGILAAIAIPQYQDYVARTKLGAMVSGVKSVQLAMAEAFQTNGTFPSAADLTAAGINVIPPKETTMAVTGGATGIIALTTTTALGTGSPIGSTLTFTASPALGDTNIRWVASTSLTNPALLDYVTKKLSGS